MPPPPRKSADESRRAEAWQERLRRGDRKLTAPRRAILRVLGGQARPLTCRAIFRSLRKGDGDLATVYRSLELLERLGMVKRFYFGDGAARFALVDEHPQGHLHHLVCTRCANLVEIGECNVGELEARVASRSHFKAVTHRLEFFGICPACQ